MTQNILENKFYMHVVKARPLEAKTKDKTRTLEAKSKAETRTLKAEAKAKDRIFCPRGQGLSSRTPSLTITEKNTSKLNGNLN